MSSSVLKWVVLCLEWLLGGDVLAGGPRFLLSINHVLSLYFINDCVLFMCLAQDSASSVPLLIAYCVCMYELCVFSRCVMHFVLLGCMQSALQIKCDSQRKKVAVSLKLTMAAPQEVSVAAVASGI